MKELRELFENAYELKIQCQKNLQLSEHLLKLLHEINKEYNGTRKDTSKESGK